MDRGPDGEGIDWSTCDRCFLIGNHRVGDVFRLLGKPPISIFIG